MDMNSFYFIRKLCLVAKMAKVIHFILFLTISFFLLSAYNISAQDYTPLEDEEFPPFLDANGSPIEAPIDAPLDPDEESQDDENVLDPFELESPY